MNKIEEIKRGIEAYYNRYPLDPPRNKTEELAQEQVKRISDIFRQNCPEHVWYLLSKIKQAEKALQVIYNETDNLDEPNVQLMIHTAGQALNDIRS